MDRIFGIGNLIAASNKVFSLGDIRSFKNKILFVIAGIRGRNAIQQGLTTDQLSTINNLATENLSFLGFFVWPYLDKDRNLLARFSSVANHTLIVKNQYKWMLLQPRLSIHIASLTQFYENLAVVIENAPWFIREGGLNFSLMLGNIRLVSIAFAFDVIENKSVVLVGAVQGNAETSQATYREIANACCDLRPRDLTFKLFRLFLTELGVQKLRCIADDYRVANHSFFGGNKSEIVSMRYDDLWIDQGGLLSTDGYYDLAVEMMERSIADVPQKKRGRYKRRLEMYELVGQAIKKRVIELT